MPLIGPRCGLREFADTGPGPTKGDGMDEHHDAQQADAGERLRRRLDAIAARLAARPEALGLLALGSVGRAWERVDAWSDLDFFVLVQPAFKQRYIDHLDWLEEAHPVVWHFRNTVDGHKALMADGVFCEFAVFAPEELAHIPYAAGRFVWRRPELDAGLASPQRPLPALPDRAWLVGELLSNLMVGLQRLARGERLAAARLVQVHALDRLLELEEQVRPEGDPATRDPFQVDRRIERRRPQLQALLQEAAGGYAHTAVAARRILAHAQTLVPLPAPAVARVQALCAAVAEDRPG